MVPFRSISCPAPCQKAPPSAYHFGGEDASRLLCRGLPRTSPDLGRTRLSFASQDPKDFSYHRTARALALSDAALLCGSAKVRHVARCVAPPGGCDAGLSRARAATAD